LQQIVRAAEQGRVGTDPVQLDRVGAQLDVSPAPAGQVISC